MKKNTLVEFHLSDRLSKQEVSDDVRNYLFDIQHEFNYLLQERFVCGPAQFISLFDMLKLRFVDNKLLIVIENERDIQNVFRVLYFLRGEYKVNELIRPILSKTMLETTINESCDMVDKNVIVKKEIEQLIDLVRRSPKQLVRVLCKVDDKLQFFNIKAYDLYYLLVHYNVVAVVMRDHNLVFGFDAKLYELYKYLFSECKTNFVDSLISNKIFFIVSLDNFNVPHVHQVFATDLRILLSNVFMYRNKLNVDKFFQISKLFLSDIKHVIDVPPFIEQSDAILLGDDKFGLTLDLGLGSSITAACPFGDIEVGFKIINLTLNQPLYSILDMQDKFPNHVVSAHNDKINNVLRRNSGFFVRLIRHFDIFAHLFSSHYMHVREIQGRKIVSIKPDIFLFNKVNNIYHLLLKKLGFENGILKSVRDANLLLPSAKLADLDLNNFNNDLHYDNFSDDETVDLLANIYNHGLDRGIIFNLKDDLLYSLVVNKRILFSYLFTKSAILFFEYGIRHNSFVIQVDKHQRVPQTILGHNIMLPSVFYQVCYTNHLYIARLSYDSILVYNMYSANRFYNIAVNRFTMASVEVNSNVWFNQLMNWEDLRACTYLVLDRYTLNRSLLSYVRLKKKMRMFMLELCMAHKTHTYHQLHESKSPKIENLDFMMDQFVFMLREKAFLQGRNLHDFLVHISCQYNGIKHTFLFGFYIDMLHNGSAMLIMFDFYINYLYKVIEFYNTKVCVKFVFKFLRDNHTPISLAIL